MTATITKDEALLKRVGQGDETAFRTFYIAYWPQVYGTALHLTRVPELARDLSQDIFLKVWERRDRLPEVERPDTYIYVLSKNHVIDYLKRKVFDPSNLDFLIRHFQSGGNPAGQELEYKELEQAINQAVDSLSGKVKDVFILSRYEGLTHEQIAARLGISALSSKTYVVRALQEIRKWLDANGGHLAPAFFLLLQALQKL